MTRAVRIDTLRSRIAATRQLLANLGDELDDLHVLAYERHIAAREVAVHGGSADWALDTHGDPRARDAYRRLGDACIEACEVIAEAAHDAIVLMRDGDLDRPNTRRRIQAEEHAEALEAQARRAARGEYTPVLTQPQPEAGDVGRTVARLRRERDDALGQIDRLTQRLARYEPPEPDRPRRRRRKQQHA